MKLHAGSTRYLLPVCCPTLASANTSAQAPSPAERREEGGRLAEMRRERLTWWHQAAARCPRRDHGYRHIVAHHNMLCPAARRPQLIVVQGVDCTARNSQRTWATGPSRNAFGINPICSGYWPGSVYAMGKSYRSYLPVCGAWHWCVALRAGRGTTRY